MSFHIMWNMARSSDVVLHEGALAVVKVAEGAGVGALEAEAERLRAARHPGVVEVLRVVASEGRTELWLAHGGRPASLLHLAAPEQVAAVAAAVARTLADLHDRGIVHGRLAARHVLVGPGGAIRLCGFGPDPGGAGPPDDVAAVGGLILELLGDREAMEPWPELRWRRRSPWPGIARRSLLGVADLACAQPPSRRPSAHRVGAAIEAAVPSAAASAAGRSDRRPAATAAAGPPRRQAEPRPVPRHLRRRPRLASSIPGRTTLAAVAGVALLVTAGGRLVAGETGGADDRGPSREASTPCAVLAAGEGCQPVLVEGTSVRVGEVVFEVGRPGDEVVVGDWDCDGQPTPAVLRPATGEVFVFVEWADDRAVEVSPVTVLPGLRDLRAPEADCGAPVGRAADGRSISIAGGEPA